MNEAYQLLCEKNGSAHSVANEATYARSFAAVVTLEYLLRKGFNIETISLMYPCALKATLIYMQQIYFLQHINICNSFSDKTSSLG